MTKTKTIITSTSILCLLSSATFTMDYQENNFYTPKFGLLKTMAIGFGLLFPARVEAGPTRTPQPTHFPTHAPTAPTLYPTLLPTIEPTLLPTLHPTTALPTLSPTTALPTFSPTMEPTLLPTTQMPTHSPTTSSPTLSPTTTAIKTFEDIVNKHWMIPGKTHVKFDIEIDLENLGKK